MNSSNHLNRICLVIVMMVFLIRCTTSNAEKTITLNNEEGYSCTPCGQSCDEEVYAKGGTCSHCQMPLVKTSAINFNTIEPSKLCDYISKNPDVILLDVRTEDEFAGRANPDFGRLKNAINSPIQQLESSLDQLSDYKNKQIIVYCSHSRRSPRASYILSQNGFRKVTNMAGGMSMLKDAPCKVSN